MSKKAIVVVCSVFVVSMIFVFVMGYTQGEMKGLKSGYEKGRDDGFIRGRQLTEQNWLQILEARDRDTNISRVMVCNFSYRVYDDVEVREITKNNDVFEVRRTLVPEWITSNISDPYQVSKAWVYPSSDENIDVKYTLDFDDEVVNLSIENPMKFEEIMKEFGDVKWVIVELEG